MLGNMDAEEGNAPINLRPRLYMDKVCEYMIGFETTTQFFFFVKKKHKIPEIFAKNIRYLGVFSPILPA